MGFNIEKKTNFWIALFILILSLIYILASFGKADWIRWAWTVFGFFIVILLVTEAGIVGYFSQGRYRSINLYDILIWVTVLVAGVLLVNSVLAVVMLTSNETFVPQWLMSFYVWSGGIGGLIAVVLGIFYMFTPKPRA